MKQDINHEIKPRKCRVCHRRPGIKIESNGELKNWKLSVCLNCDEKYLHGLASEEKKAIIHKACRLSKREHIPLASCIPIARGHCKIKEVKHEERIKKLARRKSIRKKKKQSKEKQRANGHSAGSNDIFNRFTRVSGSFRSRQ